MTDPRFRPVVALDLDGVLRVPPSRTGDTSRDLIVSDPITYRRDAYPTLHHSEPPWDENDEFVDDEGEEFSRVGVQWVHDLLRRDVDVVWATTWQHHANRYFSPALGLPELPVGVVDVGRRFLEPAEWKSVQLSADPRWVGRPLVWIDDDIPARWSIERNRRPNDRALTLSYRVSYWLGLTQRDIDELDAWLTLASTSEGHTELRRRRRAERQLDATQRRRRRQRVERVERAEAALQVLLPERHELARVLARYAGRPATKTITKLAAEHDVDEPLIRGILAILTAFGAIK